MAPGLTFSWQIKYHYPLRALKIQDISRVDTCILRLESVLFSCELSMQYVNHYVAKVLLLIVCFDMLIGELKLQK